MFSKWENISLEEIREAKIHEVGDSLLFRIKEISYAFKERGSLASKPDLIVLVRQFLVKQKAIGLSNELVVSKQNGWPTASEWNEFSFKVLETASQYKIKPKGWRPEWLKGPTRKDDIFLELLNDDYSYSSKELRMEYSLSQTTGYDKYKNIAQREALRSMMLMPKGTSLIVNIPTGTGKTLIAQAEFLKRTNRPDIPLTVVVVPTTSLAIDLERRTHEILRKANRRQWLNHNFAFYDGIPNQEQIRDAIKKRIRGGTQGILFSSPESIVRSFSPALFDAAKSNNLSHFIVDEAHMICEWGGDFRCEFQTLPGLRRGLLKYCGGEKFRTVLMSATLTPESLSTLEQLFGPKENVQVFSAVSLRSEPTYWSNFAKDKVEKNERLDETLRHIPRPFILYMSTRVDVEKCAKHLRENQKYGRIAEFHGGTGASERKRIIEEWQSNKIDGIIANSAFGLGIDKTDVRSVIHGSLPESLDRFYQEVGRGGRDGKPSASISIYCSEDISTAKKLSEDSVIGTPRAFERWSTMWKTKKPLGQNLWALNYTIPPPDIPQKSKATDAWNLKIINSLGRANLINIDYEPMDDVQINKFEGSEEEKQEFRDQEWEDYQESVFIGIRDEGHLNEQIFGRKLSQLWSDEREQAQRSLDQLQNALRGDLEMGGVLSSLYTNPSRGIHVSKVCRGCPGEGNYKFRQNVIRTPIITPINNLEPTLCNTEKWVSAFGGSNISEVYLFYERSQFDDNEICELIVKLVKEYGVKKLMFSDTRVMDLVQVLLVEKHYLNEMLFFEEIKNGGSQLGGLLQMPTVRIYHQKETDPLRDLPEDITPFPIVTVVPSDIKSHMNERRLIDDVSNQASVRSFLQWQS